MCLKLIFFLGFDGRLLIEGINANSVIYFSIGVLLCFTEVLKIPMYMVDVSNLFRYICFCVLEVICLILLVRTYVYLYICTCTQDQFIHTPKFCSESNSVRVFYRCHILRFIALFPPQLLPDYAVSTNLLPVNGECILCDIVQFFVRYWTMLVMCQFGLLSFCNTVLPVSLARHCCFCFCIRCGLLCAIYFLTPGVLLHRATLVQFYFFYRNLYYLL